MEGCDRRGFAELEPASRHFNTARERASAAAARVVVGSSRGQECHKTGAYSTTLVDGTTCLDGLDEATRKRTKWGWTTHESESIKGLT